MKVPCEYVCLAQCVNTGRKNSGTLALFNCTSRRLWCDGAHNGGLGRSVVYAEHYRHSYLDVIRLAQQCRIFAICCNMAPAARSSAMLFHCDFMSYWILPSPSHTLFGFAPPPPSLIFLSPLPPAPAGDRQRNEGSCYTRQGATAVGNKVTCD